jgi:hypothetical protein
MNSKKKTMSNPNPSSSTDRADSKKGNKRKRKKGSGSNSADSNASDSKCVVPDSQLPSYTNEVIAPNFHQLTLQAPVGTHKHTLRIVNQQFVLSRDFERVPERFRCLICSFEFDSDGSPLPTNSVDPLRSLATSDSTSIFVCPYKECLDENEYPLIQLCSTCLTLNLNSTLTAPHLSKQHDAKHLLVHSSDRRTEPDWTACSNCTNEHLSNFYRCLETECIKKNIQFCVRCSNGNAPFQKLEFDVLPPITKCSYSTHEQLANIDEKQPERKSARIQANSQFDTRKSLQVRASDFDDPIESISPYMTNHHVSTLLTSPIYHPDHPNFEITKSKSTKSTKSRIANHEWVNPANNQKTKQVQNLYEFEREAKKHTINRQIFVLDCKINWINESKICNSFTVDVQGFISNVSCNITNK